MLKIYKKREIEILTEGGRKLARIVRKLRKKVKAGILTEEIDRIAFKMMKKEGGKPSFLNHDGYPASTCISINEEVVHSIPAKRKIKIGDIVGIDAGLYYRGYHTDMAVTFAIGKIDKKYKNFIEVAKNSLNIAIKQAQPGNTIGHISGAIQQYVEKNGYSIVRELSGHGIGEELHEEPTIPNFGKAGKGQILRPGMVLAIEPIINFGGKEVETDIDGWKIKTKDNSKSAHFEHTILITKKGNKILTETYK